MSATTNTMSERQDPGKALNRLLYKLFEQERRTQNAQHGRSKQEGPISKSDQEREEIMTKKHWILLLGALLWFGLILWLAGHGAFISAPNQRPITLAAAFATPILLFLIGMRWFPGWRAMVVSIPPVFLITLNGWRFIGLAFLMGYVEGLLPGGFAWPAGLGDIAMAVTAPWIATRVATDDRFRFGGVFLAWNLFGIADFLDAVFLGTLYLWPGFTPSVSTALMQRLPFALIPGFFVPLVAMAHIALLEQRRNDR
jgi:hypothetical protein